MEQSVWYYLPLRKVFHRKQWICFGIIIFIFQLLAVIRLRTTLMPAYMTPYDTVVSGEKVFISGNKSAIIEHVVDQNFSYYNFYISKSGRYREPVNNVICTGYFGDMVYPAYDKIYHRTPYDNLEHALTQQASKHSSVVLVVLDQTYIDMGINLYRTSFLRQEISNVLFVCLDLVCCNTLSKESIPSVFYKRSLGSTSLEQSLQADSGDANKTILQNTSTGDTLYGTASFKKRTHFKTQVVLETLTLNYTAVIVDADIIFFKHPINIMENKCPTSHCDIIMQHDGEFENHPEMNSGFYLARPTNATITLHQMALSLGLDDEYLSNQKALGKVLMNMTAFGLLNLIVLDIETFPNGMIYFEKFHRTFPDEKLCENCVMLHNNWIVSQTAKIHRFRSHLMWFVDNDKYYSDPDRKYLMYENPINFGLHTKEFELQALKNALLFGYILERTVILPKFHCKGCNKYLICGSEWCPEHVFISVAALNKMFGNNYRENAFLCHPWVPKHLREAQIPTVLISSNVISDSKKADYAFLSMDTLDGPSTFEIQLWFMEQKLMSEASVIKFHNLYGTFKNLYNDKQLSEIVPKLELATMPSDYRQYPTQREKSLLNRL